MQRQRVIAKLLHPNARMPEYAHDSDSGADVFSILDVTVPSMNAVTIPVGLSVELPYGYELQARSKSGMASKKKVFVLNSPGTIDTDYRGEIGVTLFNLSDEDYHIKIGDKLFQLVLAPVIHADYEQLQRDGGFGSTGMQAKTAPVLELIPDLVQLETASRKKGYWVSTDDESAGFLNGTLGLE